MKRQLDKLHAYIWGVLFHTAAVLVVAVLVSLPMVDWWRAQWLWQSYTTEGFDPNWLRVALHLGLSACLWALVVIIALLVRERRKQDNVTRLVQRARGTVLTETLIVLVPFLLLTSGLAQLTMLNITGILADFAAFNAARVVFVWAPEVDQPRFESAHKSIHIKDRARTIASMALAPTAPNDYTVGRIPSEGSSDYFRRQRAIVYGAFTNLGQGPPANFMQSGGADALAAGGVYGMDVGSATPRYLTFVSGFDTMTFSHRAARKMTQAEWGLWYNFETICPSSACDQVNGSESGVEFTYWYNIIFPWFAYIWGEYETVGMRSGYYSKIRRRHTIPAQPMP